MNAELEHIKNKKTKKTQQHIFGPGITFSFFICILLTFFQSFVLIHGTYKESNTVKIK